MSSNSSRPLSLNADVLSYLYIGLSLGAIYAFIAVGYTMVYGIIRLINFAHGEFFMCGAFAGYFVLRDAGIDRVDLPAPWPVVLSYVAALAAGALGAAAVALLAERLCYRPLRGASRIAALLTAVGVSLLLQNLARMWPAIGPTPRSWPEARAWTSVEDVPVPADARYYEVARVTTRSGASYEEERPVLDAGATLSPDARARLLAAGDRPLFRKTPVPPGVARGFVMAALAVTSLGLWWLVRRTRAGKAMRAASEDMQAAQLMGIDVHRVVALTFFVGALVAGMGGVAYCATYGQVEPMTGFMPGLKAFVAAVLGGIGSIPGAVVGGITLGVVETLFGAYVSTQWKDLLAFAALIAVLLVRPSGLLGKPRREKV